MKNLNNNDDEFNEFNDDFYSRWNEFNGMMNSDFRKNLNQFNIESFKNLIDKLKNQERDTNLNNHEDENGKWKNWTSPDGSVSFMSFSRSNNPNENTFDEISELFKSKLGERKEETKEVKLSKLQKSLDYYVKEEEYKKAAEIKKQIDELTKISE